MADELKVEPKPSDVQVTQKQEPAPTSTSPSDIVTRVSDVKAPESKKEFDRTEHDKIIANLPPEVQTQVKAYEAELMSGANKKFQVAADIKKEYEQPWTPDRVQSLLSDQTFVTAAQEVAQKQALAQNPQGSGMQDQEWSALTDAEKKQFYAVQQNQVQMQGQLNEILAKQEDQILQTRYKNYNPDAVENIRKGLLSGKVHANREHLWKVHDYDGAVQRAYELGKQDRQTEVQGKVEASSTTAGLNVTQADSIPEKPKGMSNVTHFINLAQNRIKQMNQQSGKK